MSSIVRRFNGWRERIADGVADRRYRVQSRLRHRVVRMSDRWYRTMDRWAGWRYRAENRWFLIRDDWSDRIARHRPGYREEARPLRASGVGSLTTISIVTVAAASAIAVTVLLATTGTGQDTSLEPIPSFAAPGGIVVPDVRGDSASMARRTLIDAGLSLDRVEAVVGPPGRVLSTTPTVGKVVDPKTPVTLVVGVETERADGSQLAP